MKRRPNRKYTAKEKVEIIGRARAVGYKAAAKEFSISDNTVYGFLRKADRQKTERINKIIPDRYLKAEPKRRRGRPKNPTLQGELKNSDRPALLTRIKELTKTNRQLKDILKTLVERI